MNNTVMNPEEFRKHAHDMVDWMADYLKNKEHYAVKSKVEPGEILSRLPLSPPAHGEDMKKIFTDFKNIIIPGMTHWQSPNFFAYFPANSSFPSVLAEMLTATLGAQCMVWETSPSAAELEEMMMIWLKKMTGIPDNFEGVIQDTASTATLCAILTAREKVSGYSVNNYGFHSPAKYRVYGSTETHSSIEKAVKIAGIGRKNFVKVKVDDAFRLIPAALEQAIRDDIRHGYIPTCIVATIGTTGSTAIDPLKDICEIAGTYKIWVHIDAALAGTALVLDEYRWMIEGIEQADSFVFNPHKWMFTNFDCSAYFVKDRDALIRTFEILPEYLKTSSRGKVNDYRDWGIALGRRFRALKLWFVIRNFGVEGIQERVKKHIRLARYLSQKIKNEPHFELITETLLNTVCFRYHPDSVDDDEKLNSLNAELLAILNKSGKMFLSHTKLKGKFVLRMVTSQTDVEQHHVDRAWELIRSTAEDLLKTI